MIEKFLANENFPKSIVTWLRDQGHDVVHAAEDLVGETDKKLLQLARAEDRILLTFDRDFGELIFHQRREPARGIVLFRVDQQSPDYVLSFLRTFFDSEPELAGLYTVASPGHFRQTPLG